MTPRPTLHLPAVPHTVTHEDHSHCAFTEKVRKFSPMMRAQGWDVIHYGTDQAQSGATEDVVLMMVEEQEALLGRKHHADPTSFIGTDAKADSPLYRQFNFSLREALLERVRPGDIICAPFGKAHEQALYNFPLTREGLAKDAKAFVVETGIGYPDVFSPYRVYETEAWKHYHLGHPHRGGQGSPWEWVVFNYFDIDAWDLGTGAGDAKGPYVLYFGRINDNKGLLVVTELAKRRPDLRFVLCGQGDPTFYLRQAPNLEYLPPLSGRARSRLLGEALCVLMPSRYVEPFGGVTAEAQLCGTPVLGSTFGSFTETILHGFNGYRCRMLGDWLAALELVENWHADEGGPTFWARWMIQEQAQETYGLATAGAKYTEIFETIATLRGDGYLAHRSFLGPITKAIVPAPVAAGSAAAKIQESVAARAAGGAVSENEWQTAQQFERGWWLGNPERWAGELEKQQFYAEKMRFPQMFDPQWQAVGLRYDFEERAILDVGCGPFSLLQRARVGTGVALDPIDYGPELEAAYIARKIQRVIGPAEKMATTETFDEAWCYNCLQHVIDPQVILQKMAACALRIRLFEWLDMPPHQGHPHELKEAMFAAAFPEAEWRRDTWEVGESLTPLLYGRYLAAVVTRR